MKKFITILLVIVFISSNFSFGQIPCGNTTCKINEVCNDNGKDALCVTTTDMPEQNNTENTQHTSVMGITCDEDLLVNGQCKFNINETLGIKKGETNSVGILVQDIVLSATFFIGTVVTIALIVSGLMYIFAASSGKDPANAKKGIMGALIGLLIVVSSYIIIRLVQYIAKGF